MAIPSIKNDMFFMKLIEQGYFRFSAKKGLVQRTSTGKIYRRIGNKGYIEVAVKIKGKKYAIMAHRLIWLRFKGRIPRRILVNHIKGIKNVNKLINLELVSYGENFKHAKDTGLWKLTKKGRKKLSICNKGELSNSALLTNKEAIKVRVL